MNIAVQMEFREKLTQQTNNNAFPTTKRRVIHLRQLTFNFIGFGSWHVSTWTTYMAKNIFCLSLQSNGMGLCEAIVSNKKVENVWNFCCFWS